VHLERNVFSMLDHTASTLAEQRPAVGFEGTSASFEQLRDRALAVAAGLQEQGVLARRPRRGDARAGPRPCPGGW
jgi:acyl-CoA synthetase (AMP-forming)/AMP-acid ligase II